MDIKPFDPSEMVRGIQQLLVSDKKKIAFLFGVGTSLAKKQNDSPFIPAIGKMTELFLAQLMEDTTNGKKYKAALEEIDEELKQQFTGLLSDELSIFIPCGGQLRFQSRRLKSL